MGKIRHVRQGDTGGGVVKFDTCVLNIDGHEIIGQNVWNKNRHGDTAP